MTIASFVEFLRLAGSTMENKYNITPVRRQFLVDLRAIIAIECNEKLVSAITEGLQGEIPRYGLPFLGDNSFLPDKIELGPKELPVFW